MKKINPRISCAFLYSISKYGYPPQPGNMASYIKEMADLGFKTIEIEGIGEEGINVLYSLRHEIKETLQKYDLALPIFCTVLPKLCSPDATLSEAAMKSFRKGCELSSFLGAKAVLDNGPLIPYNFPKDMPIHRHYSEDVVNKTDFPAGFKWNKYHINLINTMRKACEIAAEYGQDYYLHPCVGSLTDTTSSYLLLAEELKCPNLKFVFDTSNLHYMRENLVFDILRLDKQLDYIHISDSFGTKIEHQPLANGKGNIEWDLLFKALKDINFKGYFAIDVGGDESNVDKIDEAYMQTANFIQQKIEEYEI